MGQRYSQPHGELVDTPSICLPSPESPYRDTGEYAAEYGPYSVTDHDKHDDAVPDLKLLCREDSAVLEENRCFRKTERQIVYDERHPKGL